jgi:hypothetical protein
MEDLKMDPRAFGGLQDSRLTPQEMAHRYCCVRECGHPGFVQLGLPRRSAQPELSLWRLLCRKHFVQIVYMQAAFMGDPSPEGEAREIAEVLGLGFDPLRDLQGASVFSPRFARCLDCGGGFAAEVLGMFSGQRYIHNCGVTNREMAEEPKKAPPREADAHE